MMLKCGRTYFDKNVLSVFYHRGLSEGNSCKETETRGVEKWSF